ncbi:hypothetical protein [Nakamurella lactea]|uniref:hypothetical protein n=1 Tax=Nakamurella lactea TaxID=459515 RepID=UPI00041A06E9|nr:hypothetical protein [Nakamurella lactea]
MLDDGTAVETGAGKLHLDSVLDMSSRRIVGLAVGEHPGAELTYGAPLMPVAVRGGKRPSPE